ncbi:hypothetical protein DFH08DRAFT_1039335 [Mycena albidolilacea]|uniref:Uncharacterized protein n=1 Tax=Mycena albidolilacea TaxID=1033008 RepID=A0AAD6ZCB8_9AGAR|nr:hypothetical protein DFH08DRAFT_1039335 [Mycena albidolilacea]
MDLRDSVPDDIWLEITHLEALKNLSLTAPIFRRLSRPTLFTHFHFHPYTLGVYYRRPPADKFEESLARMSFWCSDEIAPLVHFCKITPWEKHSGPFSIEFTRATLGRFSGLDRLQLTNCIVTDQAQTDSRSEELYASTYAWINSPKDKNPWIPVLRADRLRELTLHAGASVFHKITQSTTSFPYVYELAVSMDLEDLGILAKFPAVQALTILNLGKPVAGNAAGLLPALENYTGSCETIHIFLPLNNLTRLTITRCSPDALMAELSKISIHSITSLDVTFDNLNNDEFNELCRAFPLLTRLCVHITASTFFEALSHTPALPTALQDLIIPWFFIWNCEYEWQEGSNPAREEPIWDGLVNELTMRYPSLTFLCLAGGKFEFYWCKDDESVGEDRATGAGRHVLVYLRLPLSTSDYLRWTAFGYLRLPPSTSVSHQEKLKFYEAQAATILVFISL